MAKKKATKKSTPKKKATKKKSTPKKSSQSSRKEKSDNYVGITIIVLAVIAAVIAIAVGMNKGGDATDGSVAAKIGDTVISMKAVDAEYNALPDQYKGLVTKRQYLESVIIPEELLALKAQDVDDDKVQATYEAYLEANGLTEEDLTSLLAAQNIEVDRFKRLIRIQVYLNDTVYKDVQVSEENIRAVYDAQKDSFLDAEGNQLSYEEVKPELENLLRTQLLQQIANDYVEELKNEITVEIMIEE